MIDPASPGPAPASAAWWRDRRIAGWLIAIVLVAIAARAVVALELTSLPFFWAPHADGEIFDRGARRIVGGDVALPSSVAGLNPAYFYVLAAVYRVLGDGPWPIRIVQGLVGVVAVLVTFDAARRVLGPRPALGVAGLAALYGPAMFFEQQILGDSLALALHASALDLVLILRERRSLRACVALGAVIGAAALFRPTALALVIPAGLAVVLARRPGAWRELACVALCCAAMIAPVAARNVLVAHEPVLVSAHGGLNLWIGNGPGATGTFRVPAEVPGAEGPGTQFDRFREVASEEEGRPLSIAEADRYWTSRTIQHVASHPLDAAQVFARKVHLFWNGRELSDVFRYEFLRESSDLLRVSVRFGWIAPLALVGLAIALSRRGQPSARAVAWVVLAEMVAVCAAFVSARYRLVAVPALLVLAGVAVSEVAAAIRARERGTLGLLAAAGALAIVVVWPVRARPASADGWVEVGHAWEAQGDLGAAADAYRRALAADAAHPLARASLESIESR